MNVAVTLEEFTFGGVPPSFQFASVKYSPERRLLSFALDASFTSSGAQALVSLSALSMRPAAVCSSSHLASGCLVDIQSRAGAGELLFA